MQTSFAIVNVSKRQSGLKRLFGLASDHGIGVANGYLPNTMRSAAMICTGALVLMTASGCLATRDWVNDQLTPINSRLSNTDAKADQALAGLQNLHLEQKLVLDDSGQAPTFASGSAALTGHAKHEIAGFLQDLDEGSQQPAPASGRVFVIAGHTDSTGAESSNYELAQRRAETVAGYLVGKEGVDPMQVRVVSYGAAKPIASNGTSRGRRTNRRVEILVYQEKIVTASN